MVTLIAFRLGPEEEREVELHCLDFIVCTDGWMDGWMDDLEVLGWDGGGMK